MLLCSFLCSYKKERLGGRVKIEKEQGEMSQEVKLKNEKEMQLKWNFISQIMTTAAVPFYHMH